MWNLFWIKRNLYTHIYPLIFVHVVYPLWKKHLSLLSIVAMTTDERVESSELRRRSLAAFYQFLRSAFIFRWENFASYLFRVDEKNTSWALRSV